MTGSAIATDKLLTLRGQPIAITGSIERQEVSVVLESALAESLIVIDAESDDYAMNIDSGDFEGVPQ